MAESADIGFSETSTPFRKSIIFNDDFDDCLFSRIQTKFSECIETLANPIFSELTPMSSSYNNNNKSYFHEAICYISD